MKHMILGQEPTSTNNHPPINVFLSGPAGAWGVYDLNLMLTGPAVVPKVVPVVKLIRPPLILAPSRCAKEPIQAKATLFWYKDAYRVVAYTSVANSQRQHFWYLRGRSWERE
ncbi:hypothetical protein PIB30_094929 [Stylosanthes scabra]|uniref:Uncharacterized protein n=1 Tax=Stylosanthes scabra TaxID=79078 RepID=A0ABU6RVK6_9FABA|nr:hypothetical protein [Stylosanthes scabra]